MTTKPDLDGVARRDLDELLLKLVAMETDGFEVDWANGKAFSVEQKPEPQDVDEVVYWRPVPRGPCRALVEQLVLEILREAEGVHQDSLGQVDSGKEVADNER